MTATTIDVASIRFDKEHYAIVQDKPTFDGDTSNEHYAGYVVCETVSPTNAAAIIAALKRFEKE